MGSPPEQNPFRPGRLFAIAGPARPQRPIVIDPQADEELHAFIWKHHLDHQLTRSPIIPTTARGMLPAAIRPAIATTVATGLLWGSAVLDGNTAHARVQPSTPNSVLLHHALHRLAVGLHGLAWLLLLAVIAVAGVVLRKAWGRHRGEVRYWQTMTDAQRHFVVSDDLTDHDQVLFTRAEDAAAIVWRSEVWSTDLFDRTTHHAALHTYQWHLAQAMARHSHLQRQQPGRPELATTLRTIERQVQELEAYAVQLSQADAWFKEWRQLQKTPTSPAEYIERMDRTAAGLAETRRTATGEAAAIAKALDLAVQAAHDTAARILPNQASAPSGTNPGPL